MKKRVLQFIPSFHQGGSERQAVALTRLLKDDGTFDVFAATLNNEGVLRGEFDEIGLGETPEFPLTSFYNANFVTQVRRCAKYLREHEIDLVHTHDFYTNVFGMAAASLALIPAKIASKRETGGMRSNAQDFIEKLAFGRADAIVANSAAVRDHLANRGISGKKIHVIYNRVDLTRFENVAEDSSETLEKYGLPTDENVRLITLVANLRHDVKNVPLLLRAAIRLTETHKNAHFVIAGEGELESGLKQLAKDLGVAKNTHFIGRCTDVPALLAASYACVLTSTAEGFSNSILEYMAAGKPAVATKVGAAAEVIEDGINGFLVNSNDDIALAERLAVLLIDEKKALEMGEKGRETVRERFSTNSQLVKTIDTYETGLRR